MLRYWKLVENYWRMRRAWRRGEPPIYWPLVTSFYLNYRCNLACAYCDDGRAGVKYPDVETAELGTEQVVRVLGVMRRVNRFVSLTGGEPTLRRDFPQIARAAHELGFITHVNTNGTFPATLTRALPYLDAVSVSLDTLDETRSDATFGAAAGTTRRVLATLADLRARRERGAPFDVVVNCVITADNLDGVDEVMAYCARSGFAFTPMPYIAGPYPSAALVGNPAYERLMDRIIARKRQGRAPAVTGTVPCLERMRDFRRFDCVPMTIARIQPTGELSYPCNVLHTRGGNLLEVGSYREAVDVGRARHGYAPPSCDSRCHMSCFMDLSLILADPTVALRDGLHRARGLFA